ncbi:hypothetical protein DMUE_0783 [Dictyocoela muelleri]|nr:hypothetical protein DMUE_0783 [Dictyocoela muelleri]
MHQIFKMSFIILLLSLSHIISCTVNLNNNDAHDLSSNNDLEINNLECIENPKPGPSNSENMNIKRPNLIKILKYLSTEKQAFTLDNHLSINDHIINIPRSNIEYDNKMSQNLEFEDNSNDSSDSLLIKTENFSDKELENIDSEHISKKRSLESQLKNDNEECLEDRNLLQNKKFKGGNNLSENRIPPGLDKNSYVKNKIMKLPGNFDYTKNKINIVDLIKCKKKSWKPILRNIDLRVNLFFKKMFNTNLEISIITNTFSSIKNNIFDVKILKKELYDPFRGAIGNNELVFLITESIDHFKKNNKIPFLIDIISKFNKIIIYEANIVKVYPKLYKDPDLEDPCFFKKRKIVSIIENINSLSKKHNYKNIFTKYGVIFNLYIMMVIETFFEVVTNDEFLNSIFPELNIIYKLYKENRNYHTLKDRKTYSGSFIVGKISSQLDELKEYFYNKKTELDSKKFSEKILKIRALYLLDLFKFINVKKVYLLLYLIESIKIYHLSNCDAYNAFEERLNFSNIFNNSTGENLNILKFKFEFYMRLLEG